MNSVQNLCEKSPEKLKENLTPESPGIICATPPLRKKKKTVRSVHETSPSLLQNSRRRRRRSQKNILDSPVTEKIGIKCALLEPSPPVEDSIIPCTTFPTTPLKPAFAIPTSPAVLSKKKFKNESSPVVCKTKKCKLKFEDSLVIDDVFTIGVELPINRTLFISPGEKIEESQAVDLQEIKSTQVIDEFDTCAISPVSKRQACNSGWKPEEKISAILSAERARRSLCCEQNGSETETRKRKTVSLSPLERFFNALKNYETEKKGLVGESEYRIDSWKDFHVLDVFVGVPMMVRASGEEGLVFIVLTEDVLKNQNALESGCILRIYPPWLTITGIDNEQNEVFYTSVSGCDVRCVEGRRLEEKVELREIPYEPYRDPSFLIRALLGDD